MSKVRNTILSIALVASVAALPSAADARGAGGPASAHRGCMSNNGIPLDDGQSVVVDGVTITCNDGSVCHFAKGQLPLCYVNVQAAALDTSGTSTKPPKHVVAARTGTLLKQR